jgi:hypothetical protein
MSNDKATLQPLCLPNELQSPEGLQVFLKELPLVGLVSRRRRCVRRQLKARSQIATGSGFATADLTTKEIAEEISNLIREHFGWPNANFSPLDPCELLFCNSASGMQDVSAILGISKRFGLEGDALNDYQSLSFGQLVDRVTEAQKRRQ